MPAFWELTVPTTTKADIQFLDRFEPDVFWTTHGRKILWGTAAIVAIGLISLWSQRQKAERIEIATETLAKTADPAVLQRFTVDFKGNEIGAQALLRLADLQYHGGHLPEAAATYREFVTSYPQHPLIDTARLGGAAVLESELKFEDAKKEYLMIASRPDSFAVTAAKLGAARCCEMLGQTKEAAQYYEELMPVAANTGWEVQVAVRLAVLARTMQPAQASQPAAAANPTIGLPAISTLNPPASTPAK